MATQHQPSKPATLTVNAPGFGLQFFDLGFINFRAFPGAAFKYARRTVKQGPFSPIEQRGMNAKLAGQYCNSPFPFQSPKRNLCLERGTVFFGFVIIISFLSKIR